MAGDVYDRPPVRQRVGPRESWSFGVLGFAGGDYRVSITEPGVWTDGFQRLNYIHI